MTTCMTQQAGNPSTHYINDLCRLPCSQWPALVADVGGSLDKWVFKVGDENGNPLSTIGRVLQPTKIGGGASEGSVTSVPGLSLKMVCDHQITSLPMAHHHSSRQE